MLQKSQINRVEPLKRPRSAMAPVIMVDGEGRVKLVTGGAGGSRIYTTVIQVRKMRHNSTTFVGRGYQNCQYLALIFVVPILCACRVLSLLGSPCPF